MLPIPLSIFPLQNFNPHGYQPIHISSKHEHGVHNADTSLHRTGVVWIGNGWMADSKLDIDEPKTRGKYTQNEKKKH